MGAVSLAAYSVVGEKQGRTLEPLLTTPITTAELLIAKVLASFLPSLAVEAAGLVLYVALVRAFATGGHGDGPVVLAVDRDGRPGRTTRFACRAADDDRHFVARERSRSAQQIAVLLVLPLVVMLVGQVAGAFIVTTPVLLLISLALAILWLALIAFSAALFERETILTRWK